MLNILLLSFVGSWVGAGVVADAPAECSVIIEDIGGAIRADGSCSNPDVGTIRMRGRLNDQGRGEFFAPVSIGLDRQSSGNPVITDTGFTIEADYSYDGQSYHATTIFTWPVNGVWTSTTYRDGVYSATMTFTVAR